MYLTALAYDRSAVSSVPIGDPSSESRCRQGDNVCVLQCQPTALLCASSSAQGGYMALSVIYFQNMQKLELTTLREGRVSVGPIVYCRK